MREKKVKRAISKKRLVTTTTVAITLIIAATMILGSLPISALKGSPISTSKIETGKTVFGKPEPEGIGIKGTPNYKEKGVSTLSGPPIFSEGFEGITAGGIPPSWTVWNEDGDSYEWEGYQSYPYEGAWHVRIHYNYYGNDDWLVTPMIHVPAGGDTFEFYACAYLSSYPETWEVYISTAGNTPSDFLTSGTMIGTDTTASTTYAPYSYAIPGTYNDQDAWLAIRCISVNMFYLYVDAVSMPNLGFFEGFEGGFPPTGWTAINTNTVRPWTYVDAITYPAYVHSGMYAAWINYDSTNPSDNWLISPLINLTGYTGAVLSFWAISDTMYPGATMELHVRGTGFDDILWDMIADETWETFEYREIVLDLSAYIDEEIALAWRYVGLDGESFGLDDINVVEPLAHDCGVISVDYPVGDLPATAIDPMCTVKNFGGSSETGVPVNMWIGAAAAGAPVMDEGFEDYIPGTPGEIPSDWLTLTNSTTTYGQWILYTGSYVHSGDYSVKGDPGSAAMELYTSDAWLITKQLSLSASPGSLTFWYRAESASYPVYYDVLVSTSPDQGDYSGYTLITSYTADSTTWTQAVIDMSSYANQDVYIALKMTGSASSYWYMFVDDFALDGWTEGFEGVPSTGFPPEGWTQEWVSGTDADNEWDVSDGTSTHPSGIMPHGGTYMAQYDSYYISSGNSARLYTYAMDFAENGSASYQLSFWMNHDDGYSGSNDRVDIQVSTDASIWTTEATVSRYDAGDPGWLEHVVDLTAYASEPAVYLGFLGTSEYGNSIYVDDVSIEGIAGFTEVYNQTVLVDLDSLEVQQVTFPTWYPSDVSLGTEIDYLVQACTQLSTDEDTSNDCDSDVCTLTYTHDVGVEEITEPSGPAALDPDWLYYHGGYDDNAVGLTAAGTFYTAIRFSPTELAGYDMWSLNTVRFYDHETIALDARLKIYGDGGGDYIPGPLLSEQAFTSGLGDWHYLTLETPVTVVASEDLWVSLEFDQTMAMYPLGIDAGPAILGKGDLVALDGVTWEDLANYGLDYNWCVEAELQAAWPPGTYPVEAIIKNYGSFNETGFNVDAEIWKQTALILDELYYSDSYEVTTTMNPGDEMTITFDDVIFGPEDEGAYRLEVTTDLVDDVPENDQKTMIITIVVLPEPPVADFTYTPTDPKAGELIQFTDTSVDPDGTVVSWWWDFDDGFFSTAQHPAHVYTADGTYTVTLTVTDDEDYTDTTEQTVVVFTPMNAPETPSTPKGPVHIFTNREYIWTTDATDPDGDLLYYMWDWDDKTTMTWLGPYGSGLVAGAPHTYVTAQPGNTIHWVKVKVKDATGLESDWSEPLRVKVTRLPWFYGSIPTIIDKDTLMIPSYFPN